MVALALLDLTLRSILNDIPRDAGSIVAYLLLLFIVAVIVYGSRGSRNAAEAPPEPDATEPAARGGRPDTGGSRGR